MAEVLLQRAMVYRFLYQTECLPSPGCAVALGQARPPEPGEAFGAFPLMQMRTLPAVPATINRPAPPIPPWLKTQPVPPASLLPHTQPVGLGGARSLPPTEAPLPSAQLGVYALQALTEQDVIGRARHTSCAPTQRTHNSRKECTCLGVRHPTDSAEFAQQP